jgi:hypothetical protein
LKNAIFNVLDDQEHQPNQNQCVWIVGENLDDIAAQFGAARAMGGRMPCGLRRKRSDRVARKRDFL